MGADNTEEHCLKCGNISVHSLFGTEWFYDKFSEKNYTEKFLMKSKPSQPNIQFRFRHRNWHLVSVFFGFGGCAAASFGFGGISRVVSVLNDRNWPRANNVVCILSSIPRTSVEKKPESRVHTQSIRQILKNDIDKFFHKIQTHYAFCAGIRMFCTRRMMAKSYLIWKFWKKLAIVMVIVTLNIITVTNCTR